MSDQLTDRLKDAVRAIAALRAKVDRLEAERNAPIAVVGMACRVPGAGDVEGFWQNLLDGRDAVRPVPPDRWDAAAWHDPDPDMPGRITFRDAAFLDDVDGFDAELFGIAVREAESMDPQQRLLLEVAWHALEDAGAAPDRLQRHPVGVFLGLNGTDHLLGAMAAPDRIDPHMLSGAVASVAAGRLAFVLGLTGPALVVDTACSSSLVATHLAVASLRRGECDLALAGGAHLLLEPHVPVALSRARMLAPDGRCKPFDAAADGFGQGEGCGVVVLKRLADAVQAGDRIRAVLRGSALNHDGRAAGLTAPSGRAQEAVIRAALANAGLAPDEVDAIEAHGTGTALGDPIEAHALAAVFKGRDRPLWVGSAKSNIGHLAAGAGIVGLIKAVLMVERGSVPPSLHFERLNPHIDTGSTDIRVPRTAQPVRPRAVGVSSFGFSGTNAHVLVAPAPETAATAAAAVGHTPRLLISARTPEALAQLTAAYRQQLEAAPAAFADLCHSAAVGRARLPWWVCVERPEDLATAEPQHGPHPDLGPQPGRQVPLPLYPFERQRFPVRRGLQPPVSSPLPGHLLDLPPPGRQLVTELDLARLPWLADHQVGGRIVVPGALLLTVMAAAAPPTQPSLAAIRFLEPIVLGTDQPARLVTTVSEAGEITVSSRSGASWIVHARALATVETAEPVVAPPVAGAHVDGAAWRHRLARRGIGIGPAFQAIRDMEQADGRAAAELDRPPEIRFERLPLHPALLDAALQVAGGTLVGEATLLPVGIDAVSFLGADPGAGALRAVATRRPGTDEPAIDIVLECRGRPLALVSGMRVREVAAAGARDWLATIAWEPMPASWLPPLAEPPNVLRVGANGTSLPTVLHQLQELAAQGRTQPSCLLVETADEDPAAGAAVGLASAIAAERPELSLRCIELARGVTDDAIRAEMRRSDAEPWVRLGPRGVERPRLVPLRVPIGAVPARLSGTVLVTGGFGAIGRAVAGWAVARGAAALLVVGRHPRPLPAWSVPVVPLALDIATDAAVEALEAALRDLPPLGAIVHTAGIRGDGLLDGLTGAALEAVLRPKLQGAWTLHALSLRRPVEHFLLFGSIASFVGAAGQAAYAAANAALDAFAAFRRARDLPAKVIDWGRWEGEGMAGTLTPAQRARVDARGIAPMPADAALAMLDAALASPETRLVIAAFDRGRLTGAQPLPVLERYATEIAEAPDEDPADAVAAIVARVLGRPVEPGRPLTAYGLDSLMAVDLRNRLNRTFGSSLQLADLLSGIDLHELGARIGVAPAEAVEVMTI